MEEVNHAGMGQVNTTTINNPNQPAQADGTGASSNTPLIKKKFDKNKLGFTAIFLITLNAIFASSLTYLPGIGAKISGVSSILVWVGVFLLGIYIAFCLSELVSMFPKTGDLYNFSKVAHGNFPAFIVGWTTWIAGNIGASLAIVWALEYLFPIATKMAFFTKLIVAIAIIITFNLIALFGISISNAILAALAILTLLILAIQIVPFFVNVQGLFTTGVLTSNFNIHNFSPFFAGKGLVANLLLLMGTLFIISEAFIGMETITFLAKDTTNPEKTIPKALITAITTAGIIMILYVMGSIGVFPIGKYATALLPHKEILSVVWHGKLMPLLLGGTGIIILAPAAVWIVTGPRLLVSLAKDKLFIKQLDKIHPKTKAPINAIIFQTVIISLVTAFIYTLYIGGHHDPYKLMHEQFILLILFVLGFTIVAVSKLRKKMPELARPFKAPMGKVGPYIVIFIFIASISAYLFVSQEYDIIPKALTLIATGIPIYLLLIFYYDPEATIKFQNETSVLSFFFERFFLPKRIRKQFLENSQIRDRKILELGASSGLVSSEIAKRGPSEQIIIEQTEALTKYIKKRLEKHTHNIRCIYDEYLTARIHPEVGEVNEIFSVGILSNLHDEERYLKDLGDLLPEHGRAHIFDYVDMYKIIPNKEILNDYNKLREIFRKAGFAIKIRKIKGLLWNYLIIDAIKTKEQDVVFI